MCKFENDTNVPMPFSVEIKMIGWMIATVTVQCNINNNIENCTFIWQVFFFSILLLIQLQLQSIASNHFDFY